MDERYRTVLYPLQDQVLSLLREIDTGLYLSGGTAVSRGYLQHRYSDDLDLFANDEPEFNLWADRFIVGLGFALDVQVNVRDERFVRLEVPAGDGTKMKIEIINDVPSRVGVVTNHPALGRLDSAGNILANKLTALAGRDEPKDLADVWGLCTRLDLDIEEALEDAHSKAAGLFQADIARVLLSGTAEDWSGVRWIEPAPPQDVYLNDLRTLGERLLLPGSS